MSPTGNNLYAPPSADLDSLAPSTGGITEGALEQLRRTRGWVRLASIATLVIAALMLLGAVAMVGSVTAMGADFGGNFVYIVALLYLVGVVVYGVLGVYLFRFAAAISRSLGNRSADDVCQSMSLQRRFWRMASILGLVGCLLGLVAIAAMPAYQQFLNRTFDLEQGS